jgi:hypothetical protein
VSTWPLFLGKTKYLTPEFDKKLEEKASRLEEK